MTKTDHTSALSTDDYIRKLEAVATAAEALAPSLRKQIARIKEHQDGPVRGKSRGEDLVDAIDMLAMYRRP